MRILGIDHGDRRIGLAVSDRLQITAQALGVYQVTTEEADRKYFTQLVADYQIEKIVLGLPLRMDGTSGSRVEITKTFAKWLEGFLDTPIIFWDERLTTKQAMGILIQQDVKGKAKKKFKDQLSAVIILSSYMESLRGNSYDSKID
ncbi:MAG: Holliday junction resolvase RuvX [Candidatus Aminicenantes bacterium]|nr:Holliday junction resolvase RuvX [Candidatus Aminicenantes bacterium]